MQVTETLNDGLKREFKVVVPAADLEKEMMGRLSDLAGRAQIKGFRPGKVPVPHLKRLYGKSVMAEVVQKHVEDDAKKLLDERKIKPAYQPEVKLPDAQGEFEKIFAGQSDLAYTMAFEIVPEFELKDVSGLAFDKHIAAVTGGHIEESLKRVADAVKTYADKDREAAKDDRVTVSFTGKVDGEPFEGGAGENVPVLLGSGQFIPGFEDQLIGAGAGGERVVKVTFPEGYSVQTLAGKAAEFDVKIVKVEAPVVPEVGEELAKKLGMDSLDAFKATIKTQLEREFGQMTGMKLKRDVLDALDKQYDFALPEKLVEAEFAGIWNALTRELASNKKTFADEGTTEEDARKEYRAIAERRVRLGLVLGTMGEKLGITVTDEELSAALLRRAQQFRGQEKQVYEYYRKNPRALIELRGPIFEQKVVDHIVSKSTVTDKPVTREELQAMVRDEDEQDHAHLHGHDHDHAHDHDHGHDHAHDHDHDHDHAHDHDHDHRHDHKND